MTPQVPAGPIEEDNDKNLYLFVKNASIVSIDLLGLVKEGDKCCCSSPGNPRFTGSISVTPNGNIVKFSAASISNIGGGCVENVEYFWWTCWTGRVAGLQLGPSVFNPWKAPIALGPFTIAAHFRVEFLSCENDTWVKGRDLLGSKSCIYERRFIWEIFGWYWKC